jgi:ribosomal small subunit protein bTHX
LHKKHKRLFLRLIFKLVPSQPVASEPKTRVFFQTNFVLRLLKHPDRTNRIGSYANSIFVMGKGDHRSKRGKIRRGSNGNSRPKLRSLRQAKRQK